MTNERALTKIVKANTKIMTDALPTMLIIFLTTFCPTKAAIVVTVTKYRAAKEKPKINKQFHKEL